MTKSAPFVMAVASFVASAKRETQIGPCETVTSIDSPTIRAGCSISVDLRNTAVSHRKWLAKRVRTHTVPQENRHNEGSAQECPALWYQRGGSGAAPRREAKGGVLGDRTGARRPKLASGNRSALC